MKAMRKFCTLSLGFVHIVNANTQHHSAWQQNFR